VRIHAGEIQMDDGEGIIIYLTTGGHPIVSADVRVGRQDGHLCTVFIFGHKTLSENGKSARNNC